MFENNKSDDESYQASNQNMHFDMKYNDELTPVLDSLLKSITIFRTIVESKQTTRKIISIHNS